MPWYDPLEPMLKRNEPLAGRTTFRIGGTARMLLEPPDPGALASAYAIAVRAGQTVRILGGGSNLLVADDGVDDVVFATRGMKAAPERHGLRVYAQAGMTLSALIQWSSESGLAGLEALRGIPGTVGGAVRMNAGGKHGLIGDFVHTVWCAAPDGVVRELAGCDIAWGNRSTDIAHPIAAVEFRLCDGRPEEILARGTTILEEKKRSQPMGAHSAGCFFKNPPGDSAGRLIDQAKLKGERVGDACVSDVHANFIVNVGRATAADVLSLSETVRERVRAECGIVLENEVRCWQRARL